MPENPDTPITERQLTFIKLRTALDQLEALTLRYCLSARDTQELESRFRSIHPKLQQHGRELRDLISHSAAAPVEGKDKRCSQGLFWCEATQECLTFPCPN